MKQSAILAALALGPLGPIVPPANNIGMLITKTFPGNVFFVDATLGNDTTGLGTFRQPLATIDAAYALCVADNGDAVFFRGTQARTATLTWAKRGVGLVGVNGPSQNDRARITGGGTTVFTPLVSVTAQGCPFINVGTFYGYADASAQVCWADSGGRNYYENCQFLGGGNATAAAQAGMRSLTIAGQGENLFVDCTFGLDTVARATNANATLEFLSGTQRNKFVRPIFQMYSSLATNVHILAAASSVDRYQYMIEPIFVNGVDSAATAITADVSWSVSAGGGLILQGTPISVGAGKIAAAGPVYVSGPAAPAGATTGLGVKAV